MRHDFRKGAPNPEFLTPASPKNTLLCRSDAERGRFIVCETLTDACGVPRREDTGGTYDGRNVISHKPSAILRNGSNAVN